MTNVYICDYIRPPRSGRFGAACFFAGCGRDDLGSNLLPHWRAACRQSI